MQMATGIPQSEHHLRRWGSGSIPDVSSLNVRPNATPPPISATSMYSPVSSNFLYSAHRNRPSSGKKVRQDISEEEKQEIRMAFELFDTRKTGKLRYREVKVAMRALDFNVKKAEVKRFIEEHSRDGTEEVDIDEFMDIMTVKYRDRDPDEELAKAFRFFDEDGTGKITLKNLRKIARDLGEHITDEELGAMIDEFDKDGDGEIDESEFIGIMKRDDLDD